MKWLFSLLAFQLFSFSSVAQFSPFDPFTSRGLPDITAGLVGWWKLNESGNPAVDSSGAGNNGTATGGATLGSGYVTVNGTDGYVALDTAAPPTAETISLWFNFSSLPGLASKFIYTRADSAGAKVDGLYVYGDTIRFACDNDNSANYLYRSIAYATNISTWYHIVVTQSTSTSIPIFYLNGVVQSSTDAGSLGSPTRQSAAAAIGRYGGNNGGYFPGLIDDVRVYNRVLSADEAAYLFNRGRK